MNFIGVFIGGRIGSVLRWLICCKINSHWGVFIVNIAGAFLIGCAYEYFAKAPLPAYTKTFIMTGLLGGFTTFSTYLLDFVNLLNTGRMTEGFCYLFLSVLLGSLFLISGCKVMSSVMG